MFGSLIDYFSYTGDIQYNRLVHAGMQHQVGPDNNFMPPNQTRTLGNDDQCFWALSAMSAAEANFPNPPKEKPQWLALAQAVFNTQVPRWDMSKCNGGLKWQIYAFNNGYNYRNTISNGCFFNLGARLALYTKNQTYADWADRAWHWMVATKLITSDYEVYDGSDDVDNCANQNQQRWSYNAGILLNGAAAMYNYTLGDPYWERQTTGLLGRTTQHFFHNNVMYEPECEVEGNCNIDQLSFKAYLSRWLASTTKLAPYTFHIIKPLLRSSAQAAMAQCSGGETGRACGTRWVDNGRYDGSEGVGQQMAALEVLQTNLIHEVKSAYTGQNGGTSVGDGGAGGKKNHVIKLGHWPHEVTRSDRIGAGVLTAVVCISVVVMVAWISYDDRM